MNTQPLLNAQNLHKTFTLHNQGGVQIPVLHDISLTVCPGECIALTGPSGSGKSTFMRSLYGNYRLDRGSVWVKHEGNWVNIPQLQPHQLLSVRQTTIGYVSQFLRVIPRVSALDVAAEPLLDIGTDTETAYTIVKQLFRRLQLPPRLWHLSPTTFSGGEKQRVNIARALSVNPPILLVDEPTSALDGANTQVVIELLAERKAQGCALIGIFHDEAVRSRLCTQELTFGTD